MPRSVELQDDDAPIGRVLSRREALTLMGGYTASGLLLLAGCKVADAVAQDTTGTGSLSCAVKPALTQGPYFVDERLNRSDIRTNTSDGAAKTGALFALTFNVQRIASGICSPLPNVFVDVWHCDAVGVYSDASDPGFNTVGQNWLRGYQMTDASGVAKFTTIFPGWYSGRATHIHFKIRQALSSSSAYEFTSQLFFNESFLTSLYTSTAPYTTKGDTGRLRNASDGIYNQGGSQLLLTPTAASSGGYESTFNLGLNV